MAVTVSRHARVAVRARAVAVQPVSPSGVLATSATPIVRPCTAAPPDRIRVPAGQRATTGSFVIWALRRLAPVTVTIKGKPTIVDKDEHPRPDSTLEILAKMPVVFGEVDGQPSSIVTAGSASGITDGGAALVLFG